MAFTWAALLSLSTLLTKQHYFLDVIAGILLGYAAYRVFLRPFPREKVPDDERRLAPLLAVGAFAAYGLLVAIYYIAYALGVEP